MQLYLKLSKIDQDTPKIGNLLLIEALKVTQRSFIKCPAHRTQRSTQLHYSTPPAWLLTLCSQAAMPLASLQTSN